MSNESKNKGLSWAAILGVLFTIAWIGYVVYETATDKDGYQSLKLNELGDFFAGAGGPIVLLWIVIGYFQQSAALRLQQEELKNQVEETKNLVAQSTRQAELMAEEMELIRRGKHQDSQPRLAMQRVSSTSGTVSCKITNFGATITDVVVQSDSLVNTPIRIALWGHGEDKSLMFSATNCSGEEIEFDYVDALQISRVIRYVMTASFTFNAKLVDLSS